LENSWLETLDVLVDPPYWALESTSHPFSHGNGHETRELGCFLPDLSSEFEGEFGKAGEGVEFILLLVSIDCETGDLVNDILDLDYIPEPRSQHTCSRRFSKSQK
jgi:hypothetical protein